MRFAGQGKVVEPLENISVFSRVAEFAEPVVRQILKAKAALQGKPVTVLDVGCSYGINAATHRFPVSFTGLRRRYARRGRCVRCGARTTRCPSGCRS